MAGVTVLLVNWAGSYGGAEKYQFDIVRAFDRNHYRFLLACPDGEGPERWRQMGYKHVSVPIGPGLDLCSVWQLYRIIRSEGVDIVHALQSRSLLQGGLAAKLAGGVGVVQTEYNITLNWYRVGAYPWYVRWINNPIRRLVGLYIADRIVSVGQSGRDFYLQVLGLPPAKVGVIPAPMQVAPERARRENPHPIIGTAAELTERKGLLPLLDAVPLVLTHHPDAQFVIMGRGHLEPALRERIAQKGLQDNVRLLGFVPDASERMAEWNIFVLPSLSDLFPRAILEAMAQGLPVVSTTIDGPREMVIDGETGILVPPGDGPALAQALLRLLADRQLARDMGRRGQERIARVYAVENIVRQLDALYRAVLRRPRERTP